MEDISGNEGVFLVFRNRNRLTWYNARGVLQITKNEATVLTEFKADTKTNLAGFTVFQEFTQNPDIGGFEQPGENPATVFQAVVPPLPQPQNPAAHRLQVLPCADQLAEVFIDSENLSTPDAGKVEFQLLLFSITDEENLIKENEFATCEYQIKDLTGKEWVRMKQTNGTRSVSFGGTCGNNHPQKKYLPALAKDCCVYLPKQTYTVAIRNTSKKANILGWVHHPHLDAGETARDIFRSKLLPGQSVIVTIDQSEFTENSARNAIKINGNAVPEVNP
jgi:DNA-binding transcriptional regulator of glucitol operon